MLRFAVLAHDWPSPHFDLLLEEENGRKCRTWRLTTEPRGIVPAERVADHRLLYLDFEGPVSGERGTVSRWDEGTYQSFQWEYHSREVTAVEFFGEKLSGRARWNPDSKLWMFEGI